ncbi:30S ribosomal protein S4 [bacterium]|jgi:small subunit ribosomal protein S4|nr:30S ribosomal protein S4 [bacterium]NBX77900.1 30S ribosomal protein S4 [bacterium]
MNAMKTNIQKKPKKTTQEGAQNPSENQASTKRFKRMTEYGKQLSEKQKVRDMYGVREKQFKRFFYMAVHSEGAPGANLLSLLERRLDNVIYRLKMAVSRTQARQMIVHGHILVNGKKVSSPSYLVTEGEIVAVAPTALKREQFVEQVINKRLTVAIKVPDWLESMKAEFSGRVLRLPVRADIQVPIEEHLIVELYSK